jgi:hypothetical protein
MICTFSAKISFISGNKQKEGIETMKQKNAWLFLIIGSSVLLGLYLLFKFSMKNIEIYIIKYMFHFNWFFFDWWINWRKNYK